MNEMGSATAKVYCQQLIMLSAVCNGKMLMNFVEYNDQRQYSLQYIVECMHMHITYSIIIVFNTANIGTIICNGQWAYNGVKKNST